MHPTEVVGGEARTLSKPQSLEAECVHGRGTRPPRVARILKLAPSRVSFSAISALAGVLRGAGKHSKSRHSWCNANS
jgi:hypothetical protein